jgi:hypothetical protein
MAVGMSSFELAASGPREGQAPSASSLALGMVSKVLV